MSFLRIKNPNAGHAKPRPAATPKNTPVKYVIDMTSVSEESIRAKHVTGHVLQFFYDRDYRKIEYAPYVIITAHFPLFETPLFKPEERKFTEYSFTLDLSEEPVYFDESWSIIAETIRSHVIPWAKAENLGEAIVKYTITVSYWFSGPCIDHYASLGLFQGSVTHRQIYAKLKNKLNAGEL